MSKKIQLVVKSCRTCIYKSVFHNYGVSKDDWVCSMNKFTVIPNINIIPDWCPLSDEITHIPDPVRMMHGEPNVLHCHDMPCYLKIQCDENCRMDGETCEAVYNTLVKYGIIEGMRLIKEVMVWWRSGQDFNELVKLRIEYDTRED